ncbi:MAG TPA: FkbM family methyltransferase [Candidatus Dormibacteraeota bacterium]|nr:FkbM family methyltransferase [Candidatus Dormibacteraeota bacterium]
MRNRCQVVVLDFLRVGGRITRLDVSYRQIRLPRDLFAGKDLAGVGYVQRFADFGGTVNRTTDAFVATLPNGLRFEARAEVMLATLAVLVERFVDEEYSWLDASGRVVVDIGANIADSVVYFAKRGAAYVYGYEPDPATFAAAERNLDLNRIRNAKLVPIAVRGETLSGHISFADVLGQAMNQYPELQIVCKVDCEGCEYEIFAPELPAPAGLERVSQIMIEYHWRSPQTLITSLEAMGFRVETAPGAPGVGWIRAQRPS